MKRTKRKGEQREEKESGRKQISDLNHSSVPLRYISVSACVRIFVLFSARRCVEYVGQRADMCVHIIQFKFGLCTAATILQRKQKLCVVHALCVCVCSITKRYNKKCVYT